MFSRPQKLAAEYFGTFTVVLVSPAGAVCADQFLKTTSGNASAPSPGIALAYGLAYGAFVTATSRVSGGHLQPCCDDWLLGHA